MRNLIARTAFKGSIVPTSTFTLLWPSGLFSVLNSLYVSWWLCIIASDNTWPYPSLLILSVCQQVHCQSIHSSPKTWGALSSSKNSNFLNHKKGFNFSSCLVLFCIWNHIQLLLPAFLALKIFFISFKTEGARSLSRCDLHCGWPNWGSVVFLTGTRFQLTAVLIAPWTDCPRPMGGEACLQHPCSHATPTVAATYSKGGLFWV